MATVQAVFETYELLENILASLPAQDIFKAKAVSKTWCHLIKTSMLLRQAQISKLVNVANDPKLGLYNVPFYKNQTLLQLHPRLVRNSSNAGDGIIDTTFASFEMDYCPLDEVTQQYFTSPPCQAIGVMVKIFVGVRMQATSCTVYRKHGVRIQDLLEITGAILGQGAGDQEDDYGWYKFMWSFGEMKDEA